MTDTTTPTWRLVLDAARRLTAEYGEFRLQTLIHDVQGKVPARDRSVIQPVVQGMTANAGKGPPSPCGKPLIRIGHGVYRLNADSSAATPRHPQLDSTDARQAMASGRSSSRVAGIALDTLAAIDPRHALLVLPCSGRKTPGGNPVSPSASSQWPSALLDARANVLRKAGADESQEKPAWRRYTGTFYKYASPALADAVTSGHIVIISGGYGLVRADELIGTYNKVLRLSDWPRGLLESLLIDEARRNGATAVVAFAAAKTDYATLLRGTPWRENGIDALLVTIAGVTGGAQVEVPHRLGEAFTAFWNQAHDRYPTGTIVERLP